MGFAPSAAAVGTGLQGISDRLAALDGRLQIISSPGRGTTLVGRIPAPATEEAVV
jgi:signal transduction histidine kinase